MRYNTILEILYLCYISSKVCIYIRRCGNILVTRFAPLLLSRYKQYYFQITLCIIIKRKELRET